MKKLVGEWLRVLTWRVRCRCTRLIELFIQQRHTNSVLLAYQRHTNEKTLINCSWFINLFSFSFSFFCTQIPIPQVTKTQLTQRALKQHLRLLSLWMHLIWYVVWLFFCFKIISYSIGTRLETYSYYLCTIFFYYTSLTAKKSQWLISFVNQENCFLPNTISCWVSCFIWFFFDTKFILNSKQLLNYFVIF